YGRPMPGRWWCRKYAPVILRLQQILFSYLYHIKYCNPLFNAPDLLTVILFEIPGLDRNWLQHLPINELFHNGQIILTDLSDQQWRYVVAFAYIVEQVQESFQVYGILGESASAIYTHGDRK